MARKPINLGTPPEALDGDTVRAAFVKINDNFEELYGQNASLVSHNELSGIQGGEGGERFHVTGVEHALIQGLKNASQRDVGTASGTVAAGDDERIINGDRAHQWGDHALEDYAKRSSVEVLRRLIDGKLDASSLSANLNFYLTDSPAGVGPYLKLVSDIHDPSYENTKITIETPQLSTESALGEYIADPGDEDLHLDTRTLTITGYARLASPSSAAGALRFEVWLRHPNGDSYKIGGSPWTANIDQATLTPIHTSAPLHHVEFEAGDRMVLKLFARKVGSGADPRIRFMVGGENPMRLLMPMPVMAMIPKLSNVATSGEYEDLFNKPELKEVATSGAYQDLTGLPNLKPIATSGEYSDISGTPELKSVALTGRYQDLTGAPELKAVALTGKYSDLEGLPSGSGIEYDDLENKPDLKPVATSGEYSDLTGTPNLSAVATSGDYGDLSGTPSMPDRLGRQYVLDGDVEITGLVTGDDIHAGANAWFSKPVHATSEISVGKESTIGHDGGVLGSISRVSAFRASAHAYGRINPGGWIAGMDSNVAVNNNSTVDKVYGVGAYTQVGENTVVDKVLGFEPALNHVDPSAYIEQYSGFYFPNLQAVPNIHNVANMACFASDMPGAHMRIRGNYMRVDEDGTVNEISPSIISQHTPMTQWPLGRVGYAAPEQQETPGGIMAVGVIYLARQCRLTDLGIYLSVGMPGQGKLAVYRQSPRGFLGIKLWESAPFSTGGDGNKNTHPNMLLPSGIYLTVFISDVTNGVRTVANSMANSIFGTSGVDSMETIPFYQVGSLPQTLPADMTLHMPTGFTGSAMADFNFKVL